VVKKDWMCQYQLGLTGTSAEVEKLVPNLRNTEKYVLRYRNLQFYRSVCIASRKLTELGIQLEPWLEP
jgi:hypothetical protein